MAKITYTPDDGKKRCPWCLKDELYVKYHDEEWGIPSRNDQHLFEHLVLETFQAGLSWHTILKKRDHFRIAFHQFDPHVMANMNDVDVETLLQNADIIRSKAKILAAINNAQRYLEVKDEFESFANYVWSFTDGKVLDLTIDSWDQYSPTIPQSDAMAKDMKKRGFKFVGSTTCMAYMEAVGIVKDHFSYCFKAAT